MPTIIAPAIAAITGLAATSAAVVFISNAVVLLGTMAFSSFQKRKQERAARARADASRVDRLVNLADTLGSRELVLGRVRKGGTVLFKGSHGATKERFFMCLAMAGHECDGIEQIFFNDVPVSLDADGNVLSAPYARIVTQSVPAALGPGAALTGAVTILDHVPLAGSLSVHRERDSAGGERDIGPVAFTLEGNVLTVPDFDPSWAYYHSYQYQYLDSKAIVRWYLGAPGQQADLRLQQFFPGVWTPQHRGEGITYVICEFLFDDTAFPSSVPVVTALMRGGRVFDPRNGLTLFTETPPLMMRHILTHPHFGKRTAITPAEDARIAAAANACEPGISYTGSDWVSMFRGACVFPFGTPARDALDDLAQAMGGEWAYAAGEFFLRAGVYQLPVMHLTQEDLAISVVDSNGSRSFNASNVSPHRPRNDKVNTISARIWDAAANYVLTPISPFKGPALIADDGAELPIEVSMPAVFYAPQANHIAGIMLRDGRDPMTVTLPFKMRAYPLQLFDGVTMTMPRYGWSAKEFRILGRRFIPGGFIELTLKENSAAIFQPGAAFVPQGYASNSTLPRPWEIYPPTITAIRSGEDELIVQTDGTIVNAVRVIWGAIADASITQGGTVEIQYRRVTDGIWQSVVVQGDTTQALLVGLEDRALIYIRARSRSTLAVSDWGLQVAHVVEGKTAPPPDIEDLSISGSILSWSLPRRVPDLAGFVFRFHYGNSLDWNSAVPLHSGIVTESPYDLVTRPNGVVTIMAKAVDTTGNQSRATANIVMNLGDPNIANVIEQWDFNAMGWPFAAGEQSGWTIVGGVPTADALDSFYGTDDQSFYGDDNESFYSAGDFAEMVYVTEEISINSALAGSFMTLAIDADGKDLRIEYRLMGPGSFYGPDNASFYPADDDAPMYGPPGVWQPWPGQVIASNDVYQFRITIGAGATQGAINALVLTVDAPDLRETLADVPIAAGGTLIPYTKNFTSIKAVLVGALQANASGAIRAEADKAVELAPVIHAFNVAGVGVSGATADLEIIGY
jgi:hypothetical protein